MLRHTGPQNRQGPPAGHAPRAAHHKFGFRFQAPSQSCSKRNARKRGRNYQDAPPPHHCPDLVVDASADDEAPVSGQLFLIAGQRVLVVRLRALLAVVNEPAVRVHHLNLVPGYGRSGNDGALTGFRNLFWSRISGSADPKAEDNGEQSPKERSA
jgi:hypothetical protein